jgi:hypothetical protein
MHIRKILILMNIVLLMVPSMAFSRVPNDPNFDQWSFKDAKVYEAWEKTTGSSDVVVAVIDNGFDTFHPDIYPNVWENKNEIPDNGIDDDENGYIDDVWGWDFSSYDADKDGIFTDYEMNVGNNNPRPWVVGRQKIDDDIHHGTLVAGIIGSVGNNNMAGTGINWNVKLMNLKVLEVSGVGDLSPLVRAIYYAVDNGADIINISLEGDVDGNVKEAVKYAYDNGVAIIAASGNGMVALNLSPVYPVCADAGEEEEWILGVSAIGEDHYLAPFSSTGSDCIDITAPGVSVSSTLRYSPRHGLRELYGGGWQGTSFAAPFVSGAAALVKAIQPSWGPKEIYEALLSTVHRTPPKDPEAYAQVYGAGLLQIGNAVEYALSKTQVTSPMKSFSVVDVDSGDVWGSETKDKEIEPEKIDVFKGIDDIVLYDKGYATVKEMLVNKSEVNIYNSEFELLKTWQVDSYGKLNIEAGEITEENGLEIILSPSYSDTNVVSIYNQDGNLIKKFDEKTKHNGVSIGLIKVIGNKKEILTIYKHGDIVKMRHFDKNLDLVREIELPFIKNTGPVGAGDIDSDSIQEYVVSTGVGDTAFLAYYDLDGNIKRKFSSYDSANHKGFELIVGDYNNDNKDDVLLAPIAKEGIVRIWNNRSKKIDQWDFVFSENAKYLPVY